MKKVDYKKELKQLYKGKPSVNTLVSVPPLQYLMLDGKGSPNSNSFVAAVETLYPLAYTLKFMSKKQLELDFTVMPLEGLFWADDMSAFTADRKDEWKWTIMIMQPDHITPQMFEEAVMKVAKKKDLPLLHSVRLETLNEVRAAQVMYVGAYADEGSTIESLHGFIAQQGGELKKSQHHHHEIYLGDPRRVEPAKLKTIIRQPF